MAIPIRRKTSAAVATAFEHHALVALLRKPKRVLTDNGPEFCGPEFEKVLVNWGINHVYSTPLRPEGNGAVERCNRSLSQALRLLSDSAADWDGQLAGALVTYNTTRHSELKESPAEFLLQRKHGGVSGPIVSSEIQNSWKPGHPEFAPFRVGELVKKEAHHPGNMLVNKLQRRYDGPFVVTRVNNNGVTYIVKSEDGQEKRVHHSQLRPWKKPPAYLLRSGRCMQDLISVAPDPSLQETSAVDSAERSQDASRMSPPPPLESPRPGAGAVAEASPVASTTPPPPSSSAGLHSSRLMTDAATESSEKKGKKASEEADDTESDAKDASAEDSEESSDEGTKGGSSGRRKGGPGQRKGPRDGDMQDKAKLEALVGPLDEALKAAGAALQEADRCTFGAMGLLDEDDSVNVAEVKKLLSAAEATPKVKVALLGAVEACSSTDASAGAFAGCVNRELTITCPAAASADDRKEKADRRAQRPKRRRRPSPQAGRPPKVSRPRIPAALRRQS
ncbi:Gag-Pol polyprotein [Amphibalanus amphitrite]|uniref:Gag-Pol polyprotein n=1 Tax=Amphibalanus amphitrite TaxID=1232801 RepID=A0A6A4WTA6_AMPAM|nr:Gag-Pol polyprotein [Amphibalanus amphitrite]